MLAALDWVREQSGANASALVLAGDSVGGVMTVAVASRAPAGVVGYVDSAGSIGGSPSASPGKSCDPDRLREVLRAYGKSTNLWIYAEIDHFWEPAVPKRMARGIRRGWQPVDVCSDCSRA